MTDDAVDSSPPQDNAAEMCVLGAMLLSKAAIEDCLDLLDGRDFYRPAHEQIFDAIVHLHTSGEPADAVTVMAELQRHDVLMKIGGAPYLHTLTAHVPITANASYYAAQVAEAAGARRLEDAGRKVSQLARTGLTVVEKGDQARKAVDDALDGKTRTRARTLAQIMPEVIEAAEHGQTAMLSTPWPDLDRLIGGLAPGRLVVFGASPGIGKSIVGTNLALHFAYQHQHAALLSSMEMPEIEVGQRLLAAHASVNLTGLQMGTSDERSWGQIAAKHAEIAALPIAVDDTPTQTVMHIRRAARDLQRVRPDLSVIVVDYLQLVHVPDSRTNRNRAEEISEISRGLKLLARESGACVVALCQINRAGADRDGGPRMSDIREGGAENDADQVILMHRPDRDVPEVEVNVGKNRHGPQGVCTLQMQGHYARLVSVQAEWSPSRSAGA